MQIALGCQFLRVANFAEALAEGRGRRAGGSGGWQSGVWCHKRVIRVKYETVQASSLRRGDIVRVECDEQNSW